GRSARTRAATSASAAVFTVAGWRRRYSTVAVAPKAAATPAATRRTPSSTTRPTPGRKYRVLPRRRTSSGITFHVSPPWTWVTLTTAASTGDTLRLTIVWNAPIIWAAATT